MENETENEPDQRQKYLKAMRGAGFIKVWISFDGGGDDGQIENIMAETIAGKVDDLTKIPLPYSGVHFTEFKNMHELVEQLAYDVLVETDRDWVNNDGGRGEIIIVPAHDEIAVEMNIRYTEIKTEYFHLGYADDEHLVPEEEFGG